MAERDYYTDLGLMPYATSAEIKSAFYAAAKQHHPDKSGSADSSAFRQAREAYEKLSDATYRADYDQRYRRGRMNVHGTDDEFVGTRTAAFEAEEAERQASEAKRRPRAPSPPPYKPVRKPNQSNPSYYLGKPYLAWQKRQEAWEKRHPEYSSSHQPGTSGSTAHGVRVAMSSHPATTQDCKLRTNDWITPSGLTNSCVFCLKCLTGCFKCPGCEVLACRNCLAEIMGRERDRAFAGLGASTSYYASCG